MPRRAGGAGASKNESVDILRKKETTVAAIAKLSKLPEAGELNDATRADAEPLSRISWR